MMAESNVIVSEEKKRCQTNIFSYTKNILQRKVDKDPATDVNYT